MLWNLAILRLQQNCINGGLYDQRFPIEPCTRTSAQTRMPMLLFDIFAILAVMLWVMRKQIKVKAKSLPLPPGPRQLPLIGNAFAMPTEAAWEVAMKWKEQYGDLVYLETFGRSILFLNSYDAAVDLLDKRSKIYSNRPHNVMLNDMQKWDWVFVGMNYGERWRRHRVPLQKFFEPSSTNHFVDSQLQESHKLLSNLLDAPGDFCEHIRGAMGSLILRLVYGHKAIPTGDPLLSLTEEAARTFASGSRPGAFLVEIFPLLKWVPEFFPGGGFRTIARKGAIVSHDFQYKPYFEAKGRFLSGNAMDCFVTQLLEERVEMKGEPSEEDDLISATAAVAVAAASDTTASALMTVLLAMTLYPEAQRKAQEELDNVIGKDRLAELADQPALPYVSALIKESIRWQPVTPMAIPHQTSEDDVYNGWFIPSGTTVIPNVWAFSRDPSVYPNPEKFLPERFLNKGSQRDPMKAGFGFGRRVCPGRNMAEKTIFLMVSRILATFNIGKIVGSDGKEVEPVVKYVTTEVVRYVEPFDCSITPRSQKSAVLIQRLAGTDH